MSSPSFIACLGSWKNRRRHDAILDATSRAHHCALDAGARHTNRPPAASCFCQGVGRRIWTQTCSDRQRVAHRVDAIREGCAGCGRRKVEQ